MEIPQDKSSLYAKAETDFGDEPSGRWLHLDPGNNLDLSNLRLALINPLDDIAPGDTLAEALGRDAVLGMTTTLELKIRSSRLSAMVPVFTMIDGEPFPTIGLLWDTGDAETSTFLQCWRSADGVNPPAPFKGMPDNPHTGHLHVQHEVVLFEDGSLEQDEII